MPRDSRKVERRTPEPDPVFGSTLVSKFINNIMRKGKKSLAQRLFYRALAIVEQRTKQEPIKVFEKAIQNVLPTLKVKSRRVGGATYQVPIEVRPEEKYALAMRWIIAATRSRGGKDFASKLKYAKLWGRGKFDGQRVQRDYPLQDGDIIEFHI